MKLTGTAQSTCLATIHKAQQELAKKQAEIKQQAATVKAESEPMYIIRHQAMQESLEAIVVLNNCPKGHWTI